MLKNSVLAAGIALPTPTDLLHIVVPLRKLKMMILNR